MTMARAVETWTQIAWHELASSWRFRCAVPMPHACAVLPSASYVCKQERLLQSVVSNEYAALGHEKCITAALGDLSSDQLCPFACKRGAVTLGMLT